MFKKINLLLLLLFTSGTVLAQNEISPDNYLQWGTVKIPIQELVNGSNGQLKIKAEDLFEVANEPMVLIKDGKDAHLKSFYFIITQLQKKASPVFEYVPIYEKSKATSFHGRAYLEEHLKDGEFIYLRNLIGKDSIEHFLTIEIERQNPIVKKSFKLPKIPQEEVFEFQILDIEEEKVIVKIDTTNEKTLKIHNMYKNKTKYNVVHLPNFKTTRRYITKSDLIHQDDEQLINLVETNELKNTNINLFPEFWEYDKNGIMEIKWGNMVSSNSYGIYDLQDAIGSRFILSQGFQSLPILRMKVIVASPNQEPISYLTEDINHPKLQSILALAEENTTILITDILIKNNQGEGTYFPPSFQFNIE